MMRQARVLLAAAVAVALMATPVQALAHHRPAHRRHSAHAHRRHRHRVAHAQSQRSAAGRAGTAIVALSPRVHHQTAHAASGATVTIADFNFSPATITIHVGDTVTWTNHGPSAHTATASNGSFNTGVLQKGQSASHTFTKAGTFAYICSIHPFMHGTVVVLASTTSTTTAPASTTPTSTTPASTTPAATTSAGTTAAQSTANTLPMTGFAVTGTVLAGVLLAGVGLALRRKIRA